MSTIAYFISDHGFGHATRSIAIIRSLLECDLDISINIHTFKPLFLVQKSFATLEDPKRLEFNEQSNDIGFIGDSVTGKIDYRSTAKDVHKWIQNWHSSYLFEEYCYLKRKKIDLIISDIAPQPFLLAKKLQVPSIAISNFTWFDIYQNPVFHQEDLESIWMAYREASLGLILPFNLDNTVYCTMMETNLVSRNPTRTKQQMITLLDLDSFEHIIYSGTGGSFKNPFKEEWKNKNETAFILGGQPTNTSNNVRTIPILDPEGQDYIACSDFALIKFSYSSVSEAIRSHVPILGVDFAQTTESILIKRVVENLGIGMGISIEEYFQGKWKKYIPLVLEMRKNYSNLPERFVKNGEAQIANIILELLEDIIY